MREYILRLIVILCLFTSIPKEILGQNTIDQLFVTELNRNDSIIDFLMIDFVCEDLSNLSKLHITIENEEMQIIDDYKLDIIIKEGKYFLKLLNDEEILLQSHNIVFVTPLKEPSDRPYEHILIEGITSKGTTTNQLVYQRQ